MRKILLIVLLLSSLWILVLLSSPVWSQGREGCMPIADAALTVMEFRQHGLTREEVEQQLRPDLTSAQRQEIESIITQGYAWEISEGHDSIDFANAILVQCLDGVLEPWHGDGFAPTVHDGLSVERATEIYLRAYTAYAAKHPGFQLPDNAPVIHLSPIPGLHQLYGLVCFEDDVLFGGELVCKAGEIYIWDQLDFTGDVQGSSSLFHEMIHYLQWVRHGAYTKDELADCEGHKAVEEEAYALEYKELLKAQSTLAETIRRQLISEMFRRC